MSPRIAILITCEMTVIGVRRSRIRCESSAEWPSAKQTALAPIYCVGKPSRRSSRTLPGKFRPIFADDFRP